jgi:hypothetical protein
VVFVGNGFSELAALYEQIALALLCCWCGVSAINGCLCSKPERLLSPLPRSQVLRDRLLTPAADVYALGVLLWQVGSTLHEFYIRCLALAKQQSS